MIIIRDVGLAELRQVSCSDLCCLTRLLHDGFCPYKIQARTASGSDGGQETV